MTDYTRYVENRLEQWKLNEEFKPILLNWIRKNTIIDLVDEDVEDPADVRMEVVWK